MRNRMVFFLGPGERTHPPTGVGLGGTQGVNSTNAVYQHLIVALQSSLTLPKPLSSDLGTSLLWPEKKTWTQRTVPERVASGEPGMTAMGGDRWDRFN